MIMNKYKKIICVGSKIICEENTLEFSDGEPFIVIADSDEVVPCDIGVGKDYSGSAGYVVYNWEDVTEELCDEVFARKYNEPLVIAETERFVIREISLKDLDSLYELYDSLADCEFVEPLYEREMEEEFTKNYINNMYGFFGYGLWLVFSKHTGELVGRIGIENRSIDGVNCQELGYLVDKKWQRKGAATEVLSKIIEVTKERYGLDSLFICTDKNNIPSQRVAKKLGFEPYATDCDGMNIYRLSI